MVQYIHNIKKFNRKLFTGKLTKHQFMFLYIPAVLILVFAWALSRIHYPGEGAFSIETNMISNQGNFFLNPKGAWYFILSTIFMGFSLTIFFPFLNEQLKPRITYLSDFMKYAGIAGGIGFIMVGVFPEGGGSKIVGWLHFTGAIISFVGLGFGALASLVIIAIQLVRRDSLIEADKFIVVLTMVLFFTLMLWTTNENSIKEWVGLYIIFTWSNAMVLILPNISSAT